MKIKNKKIQQLQKLRKIQNMNYAIYIIYNEKTGLFFLKNIFQRFECVLALLVYVVQ